MAFFSINIYSNIYSKIGNFFQSLTDQIKIIYYQDDFFFGELADRAVKSKEGVASAYLGFPLQNLVPFQFLKKFLSYVPTSIHFYVYTNPSKIQEVADYGNWHPKNPHQHDPKARTVFSALKKYLKIKYDPIILQNDIMAKKERHILINKLNPTTSQASEKTEIAFEDLIKNWSSNISLNSLVQDAIIKILADTWLDIPDIPEEAFEPLRKAEHYVFNSHSIDKYKFDALATRIKTINDAYCDKNEERMRAGDGYASNLVKRLDGAKIKDVNPIGSLVVEGNLTALILMAILQIAASPDWQSKLRLELRNKGLESEFLAKLYIETLRFASPAGPISRYVSKNSTIAPPRSFVFVPLRRILLGAHHGNDALEFNPLRPISAKTSSSSSHFMAFSLGTRLCPASYGYVETIFKKAILTIFSNHELTLRGKQQIETISVSTKQPRLKNKYYGTLKVVDPVASNSKELLAFQYGKTRERKAQEPSSPEISPTDNVNLSHRTSNSPKSRPKAVLS